MFLLNVVGLSNSSFLFTILQITKVISDYNEQITKKGKDINEYKEKYNIKVRGQDDMPAEAENKDKGESSSASKNVMVEAM